ncbi:hypothetical protein K431DRAFT_96187 [Polychaeton citri CBS 116435]|uniref:Uncharacterized protein n=1 Tax=Polychaeton citri CBS 116435 TaxID=1314669 RepID=A0A9P4Q6G5_9PEZI|nr:hypothetical protein K431DRAFT_96187 [Polychaeton citri CBS 116435]
MCYAHLTLSHCTAAATRVWEACHPLSDLMPCLAHLQIAAAVAFLLCCSSPSYQGCGPIAQRGTRLSPSHPHPGPCICCIPAFTGVSQRHRAPALGVRLRQDMAWGDACVL